MSGRNYNLRASPGRARVATTTSTSATSTSFSSTTSVSSSNYSDERTLTPAPVQRTLYMEEADDEDEDDDEEVVEQLNGHAEDVEEVQEMDTFGRGVRLVHEDYDDDDDEEEEAAETEEDEEEEFPRGIGSRINRSRKQPAARRESAFGDLRRRAANSAFVAKLSRSRHVQQATSAVREFWHFIVRNSFMTFNFMWLLVPLGCFLIAILVPHYLTTAIRYVDILTTSSNGFQANLAYEKGMMRSIVQEIVDVKLSTMQEEITSLRNTIVTQEREFEGLRLLHESLRQVHEDTQKKLSVVDSNSILSIHIEHVVSKHAETLWKRFQDKTAKIEETIRATTNQQHELKETIAHQHDDILELKTAGAASSTAKPHSMTMLNERALKEELQKWKVALQEELHMSLEREVVDIEDRMHKSLLSEKQSLEASVKTLKTLDATNPALVSMIESAVVKVEKKKSGAPDYAALANGAAVVHHESDLLDSKSLSPVQFLETAFGFTGKSPVFTSSSLRSWPLLKLSSFLIPQEIPWWLSRHNARPETALSETKEIGSCWGLAGPTGRLTVKFARRIFADSVTIDHIPEEIATDFSTAPQNFRVFGVAADRSREAVEFLPFGNFTYGREGAASQTFRLATSLSQRIAVDAATLEITSNHGHPDYTCLYRFQVHGTPAP